MLPIKLTKELLIWHTDCLSSSDVKDGSNETYIYIYIYIYMLSILYSKKSFRWIS